MSLSLTLDVVISLIFTWFLAALLVGAANEVLAGWLNVRGAYLTKAIETLTSLGITTVIERSAGGAASVHGLVSGWLRAVPGRAPANPIDKAAVDAFNRAKEEASKVGATIQSVLDAIKSAPDFKQLGLARRLDDAAQAPGATPTAIVAALRPVAGLADLQNHPLLLRGPKDLPSYLPSRDFSDALASILSDGKSLGGASFVAEAKTIITDLPDCDFKTTLLAFINAGADDLVKFKARLEHWFDDSMARVGGLYKRYTQYVMFFMGFFVAITANFDSIHVTRTLWEQPQLAQTISKQAENYVTECSKGGNADCVPTNMEKIRDLIDTKTLPIWWTKDHPVILLFSAQVPPGTTRASLLGSSVWSLLGWIITAFAISLGAQFWFDLLTKFVNLRAAGPKPERAGPLPTTAPRAA